MAQTANTLFEKSNTSEVSVHSESNGFSVGKVLNAILDDRFWSLFTTIAMSSDPASNGQESGDGGQILLSRMNLTRRQYYQRINRLRSLDLRNRNPELMETALVRVEYGYTLTISRISPF